MTPRVSHQHDILRRQSHCLQQLDAGDRGGAGAVDHHFRPVEPAAGQMEGVDQASCGDNCCAVLIVVEHRDIEELTQPLFDDEAFRCLDVFEVDAAEGRVQETHAVDELVDVAGIDLEINRVDVGKALEQCAFALHDRLGERAEIAEPQDRGAVRDHRDKIALRGVIEGGAGLTFDMQTWERHTGRIGQREIALCCQGLGRRDR
jgi:hypothetical protein